jgi:hypothetical protein
MTPTNPLTQTARDIITNPQFYHHVPAVLQASWAEIKAQRGQPITPDRMNRLHPNYGILPVHAPLCLPAPLPVDAMLTPVWMARVREIKTARGITASPETRFGPYGGDAA